MNVISMSELPITIRAKFNGLFNEYLKTTRSGLVGQEWGWSSKSHTPIQLRLFNEDLENRSIEVSGLRSIIATHARFRGKISVETSHLKLHTGPVAKRWKLPNKSQIPDQHGLFNEGMKTTRSGLAA